MINAKIYKTLGINVGDILPAFTSIGSYTIVYHNIHCDPLCAKCAQVCADDSESNEYDIVETGVYWEGPTVQCAGCDEDIESSYGDPDNIGPTEFSPCDECGSISTGKGSEPCPICGCGLALGRRLEGEV